MTLRSLEIFQAVYRCGTTAKAALDLNTSQPSISTAIRELEREYGVALFNRINNRLHITADGETLHQYAAQILSLRDRMDAELKDSASRGSIHIGSSITIAGELLPSLVQKLQKAHEKTFIDVWVGNTDEVCARILSNQLDVALIESIPRGKKLTGEQFGHDNLVFVCGNDCPLAYRKEIEPKLLLDYQFAMREEGSAARKLVEASLLSQLGTLPPIAWECGSNEVILQAAKAGLGVAVLPESVVALALSKSELSTFSVRDIHPMRPYYIIRHSDKCMNALLSDFWDLTMGKYSCSQASGTGKS